MVVHERHDQLLGAEESQGDTAFGSEPSRLCEVGKLNNPELIVGRSARGGS